MRYGEWIGRGALAVIFPLNGLGIVAFWAYHGPELRGRLVNVLKTSRCSAASASSPSVTRRTRILTPSWNITRRSRDDHKTTESGDRFAPAPLRPCMPAKGRV